MRQYPRRAAPGPGAVRQCASDVGNRLGARGRQGFPEHTLRGNRRRQGATAAVSLDRQPRIAERDNVMTIAEAIGDFANVRARIERRQRSEEHTSELQSLMRISYAVFCLKKKKKHTLDNPHNK